MMIFKEYENLNQIVELNKEKLICLINVGGGVRLVSFKGDFIDNK